MERLVRQENVANKVETVENVQPENQHTDIEFYERLKQRSIKLEEAPSNLKEVSLVIKSSLNQNLAEEQRVIDKLKQGQILEGQDMLTSVSTLENADFSVDEIEMLLAATQNDALQEVLAGMVTMENEAIKQRIDNPEFLKEADMVMARIKLLALRLGVQDQVEERWPTIVYTGKVNRMLRRTNDVEVFDPHACSSGEYVHDSKSAYVTLSSDKDLPLGKEVLKLQTHEIFHGISRNKIDTSGTKRKNESGFGTIVYDHENPLESTYDLNNFNEGFTEYFARTMTSESFPQDTFKTHSYDGYVLSVSQTISFLAQSESKSTKEIEEDLFVLYIEGDQEKFRQLIQKTLGEYGSLVLDILPKDIDLFFKAYSEMKQNGHTDLGCEIEFESLKLRGVSVADFKKQYPFVKVMKDELDFDTFENKRVEVQ